MLKKMPQKNVSDLNVQIPANNPVGAAPAKPKLNPLPAKVGGFKKLAGVPPVPGMKPMKKLPVGPHTSAKGSVKMPSPKVAKFTSTDQLRAKLKKLGG